MRGARGKTGSGGNVRMYGWVVVRIIFLVVILVARGPILHVLTSFSKPFVTAGTWVNQKTYGRFQSTDDLLFLVQNLEETRQKLAPLAAKSVMLEEENQALRGLLQFTDRRVLKSVTASVVARSLVHQSSKIVVDRGSDDGVQVGYPVFIASGEVADGQGILVGKVTAVTSRSATVTTLTDPELTTAATIVNSTHTIGVVNGIAGTLLSLQFVPQEETLEVNQLVLTSGLEPNIPSGFVIGLINAIYKEEAEPFQEAIVEPLGDARRISVVSILLPDNPSE